MPPVTPSMPAPIAPQPTPPPAPVVAAAPTPVKAPAPPPPTPPSAKPMMVSSPSLPSPPVMPVAPVTPPVKQKEAPIDVLASGNLDSGVGDDILGVNTGSWMNPAESIGYEQYSDSGPISSTLMDSDKAQMVDDEMDEFNNEDSDSIDGFAATSGLKGLTEFMDFDLKRKKS
jgi:hypothetical protein